MSLARKAGVVLAAGGSGLAAFFLFTRSAKATENDQTGEDVDPSKAIAKPTDPVLDPTTTPSPGGASSSRPAAQGLGQRAVDVLMRDIGAKEVPDGSNRGPAIEKYQLGLYGDGKNLVGLAWCARAARYAYEKAAQELGLPSPFANVKSTLASTSSWKDALSGYELKEPKVGALGLRTKNGSHAMIISRVESPKVIYTVEGNHSNSVATVKRKPSDFDVYLDVERFAADQKPKMLVSGDVLGIDILADFGSLS